MPAFALTAAEIAAAEAAAIAAAEAAAALVVLVKLTPDLGFVLVAVQFVEDLAHQFLLVRLEHVLDLLRRDVPVVIDFEATCIAPREAERLALRLVHAAVELLDERFRCGGLGVCGKA